MSEREARAIKDRPKCGARRATPLTAKRTYKVSQRTKRHPKDPDAAPQNTSVHGKNVLIGPEGTKIEVLASFPATIKDAYKTWQVGSATIDDKPVQVLQGTNAGQLPVNFYFDSTGLLVRSVRWNRTPVGTVPSQIDYSDYRDVAGVKMPFKTVITWTDGQNTITLSQVQPNAVIEAAKFATPKPFAAKQ